MLNCPQVCEANVRRLEDRLRIRKALERDLAAESRIREKELQSAHSSVADLAARVQSASDTLRQKSALHALLQHEITIQKAATTTAASISTQSLEQKGEELAKALTVTYLRISELRTELLGIDAKLQESSTALDSIAAERNEICHGNPVRPRSELQSDLLRAKTMLSQLELDLQTRKLSLSSWRPCSTGIQGDYGPLFDHFSVRTSQTSSLLPLCVILGAKLWYRVVENLDVAQLILQHARQNGRQEKILLLSQTSGRHAPTENLRDIARSFHGKVLVPADLIQVKAEHVQLFSNILGSTVISHDDATARALLAKHNVASVTLEGVTHNHGCISGGYRSKESNTVLIKSEVDAASAAIDSCRREIAALEVLLTNSRKLALLEDRRRQLEETAGEWGEQKVRVADEITELEENRSRAAHQLEQVQLRMSVCSDSVNIAEKVRAIAPASLGLACTSPSDRSSAFSMGLPCAAGGK